MAGTEVEGAGAAVLVTVRSMIRPRFDSVGQMSGGDHVPQILRRLREAWGDPADDQDDEDSAHELAHLFDYSSWTEILA